MAAVELDPEFTAAYADLAAVPERNGHLDARSRALIALAVSASVATLDPAGVRTAVAQAARAGATREEVVKAVQLASVLGVHTLVTGFPEPAAVPDGRGERLVSDGPLIERQEQISDDFRAQRGYWSENAVAGGPRDVRGVHGVLVASVVARSAEPETARVDLHRDRPVPDPPVHHRLVGIASVWAAAPVIREVFG